MIEVKDVFCLTKEDMKRAKARRANELRKLQMQMHGLSMREILQFGVDWQEVTGNLLKKAGKPGWEEKSADLYRRKRELERFEDSGMLKR